MRWALSGSYRFLVGPSKTQLGSIQNNTDPFNRKLQYTFNTSWKHPEPQRNMNIQDSFRATETHSVPIRDNLDTSGTNSHKHVDTTIMETYLKSIQDHLDTLRKHSIQQIHVQNTFETHWRPPGYIQETLRSCLGPHRHIQEIFRTPWTH